ncbi:hypothetical protein [Actinomadura litoris]|uniref:Uncharacterized protein n=1 Tax=Actinomadura litoris TaxID=2678616 RepID=A0A7K1L3V5_9ACTN|nr:hypothetical protein [Actinomadura litoris]MUN38993.1 hypothetical protein [Actinomadura litoris]
MSASYDVEGKDGVFVIAEQTGKVIGVFYAESDLGWWRGHVRGRVRRLFIPAAEPLDVGRRFLSP